MPISRIMIALGIHLIIPPLGIGAFVLLNRRMRRALVPSPPVVSYSILFAILAVGSLSCLQPYSGSGRVWTRSVLVT